MLNTDKIFEYFEDKYGLGHIGLFKCIALASLFIKNKEIIPLSVICIAPSGQFKSRSTIEMSNVFVNKSLIHLGSDFTIHSLMERFDYGKKCNNKTLCINDLTLLLSSKIPRAKQRLVNAFAEILSEGVYLYGERLAPNMKFEARINLISNITLNSYMQNKKELLENTFIERLVPFFYNLSNDKQVAYVKEINKRKNMQFGKKIRLKQTLITNFEEFNESLIKSAIAYKSTTLSSSLPRSIEKVKAIIGGMCVINGETEIRQEYVDLFNEFLIYFKPNVNKDSEIIRLYNQGLEIKEICKKLNYSSKYPYKVIQRYKERGVLS